MDSLELFQGDYLIGVLFAIWFILITISIFIAKKNKQSNWMYSLILHFLLAFFLLPLEIGLVIPTVYVLFFQKKFNT